MKFSFRRFWTARISAPDKGIWVDRVFTSDKNHVSSVTDAEGNTTRYTWDTAADLLDALTDGRGEQPGLRL